MNVNKEKQSALIDYTVQFTKNQEVLNEKYTQLMASDSIFTSSYKNHPEINVTNESGNRNFKGSTNQANDLNDVSFDGSKLVEEDESVDDDKFFDALDESDKNLYNTIKSKRMSIDNSREGKYKQQEGEVEQKEMFKKKMFVILEANGLVLAVNGHAQRYKYQNNESNALLKLQIQKSSFGMIQNVDSLNAAVCISSFTVRHWDQKILYSRLSQKMESHENHDESRSSYSQSNNSSMADHKSRQSRASDQFLVLSYVQNTNNILEPKSAVNGEISILAIEFSDEYIEAIISVVPGNISKLIGSKPKVAKVPGIKRPSIPQLKNLSMSIPAKPEINSQRSRHSGNLQERKESRNLSIGSSYFFDAQSQKGENISTNSQLSVQVKLAGVEGQISIGDETTIEFSTHGLKTKANFSNSMLKSVTASFREFEISAVDTLKLSCSDISNNSNKVFEVTYNNLSDEDFRYTQSQ